MSCTGEQALDSWEHRLESLFEGRPYDAMDAALTDTVAHYPVSIQPFKDMVSNSLHDSAPYHLNAIS